ncbi:hypothetical protein FZC76_06925 [Sutcliffiella horikoshii]|uniref:Uncharacterized protein n=1 Tax=Sutcliffiella horikoshii TaxID=79883 RepID=A0A5D4SZE6_9BACI|nr:hypothetical protein [Sutcliffiella horikoshii]TYS68673.1 hypothetical protein FZC76_06925 [Sutcliffiella horikoshii]
MEFIKKLVETDGSLKMKEYGQPIGTYEDMGFRMFKQVKISDEVGLSIQASYGHYCSPRKTLPLEMYSSMELAIFKDGEFVSVQEVTENKEVISELSEHYEGTVYGGVPVETLEKLYKDLIGIA